MLKLLLALAHTSAKFSIHVYYIFKKNNGWEKKGKECIECNF